MNTLTYIDLYCERTGPEFWNEPVNAISNVAFLLAAVISWRTSQRRRSGDVWEKLLIILAGTIGVGSYIFHTFARGWAEVADVIPIWSFVAAYVLLAIYRSSNHDVNRTVRIALIAVASGLAISWFTAAEVGSEAVREPVLLNGSLQYAPAILALIVFTLLAYQRSHPVRHHFFIASFIFCIALICRTVDQWVCSFTAGIGTHFLWHLFDALMIGVLLHAMITKMPPPVRSSLHPE